MFRTISEIFEKFQIFRFFLHVDCRGGGGLVFTFLTFFLISDVNDAVFSILIVPDTFPSFCKIFKFFQFLHVECVCVWGGGVHF